VIMWFAVLVVWNVLWIGWWLRWGRHWHPIRQFRYEWGRYRRGTFKRSSESEAAYRQAPQLKHRAQAPTSITNQSTRWGVPIRTRDLTPQGRE
jgi:hypothetical protein